MPVSAPLPIVSIKLGYNSFLKNYIKLTGMSPDAPKPWYVVALVMRRAWDIASEKEYLEGEIVRLVDEMK